MRTIAFVNEKGGSCKTTLSVNIAAHFASRLGQRVLLVDLDPQGQSGKSLGLDVKGAARTTLDLLMDPSLGVTDVAVASRIPGLDVVIANKTLTDFPIAAGADDDRALKLKSKIDAATGYDFVVFDSPPSLGLITVNIMVAAREIVIPVNMTFLALDGCAEIVETVEAVRESYDCPDLRVSLVVPVLYRNTRLANAILEKLREFFAERLSSTIVGYNVAIDEAQSYGQTIWEYAPRSRGAELLEALAKEIYGAP